MAGSQHVAAAIDGGLGRGVADVADVLELFVPVHIFLDIGQVHAGDGLKAFDELAILAEKKAVTSLEARTEVVNLAFEAGVMEHREVQEKEKKDEENADANENSDN